MMKFATIFLAPLLLLYGAACAYMYFNQRAMIYFPTPVSHAPGTQVLLLENEGVRLRIWHAGDAKQSAIIYFGGNAEDVAQNIPQFERIFPDHALYLVNYRGYGGSTGHPTEAGLFADALAIHDFVRAKHGSVAVIGRSLGSGVAMYLASVRAVDRLALVTPFDSLANVAQRHYPLLPVALLLRDKYQSVKRAAAIDTPTLILAAQHDEIIPRVHAERLAAAFPPARARMAVVPDTGHNSIGMSPFYADQLGQFFSERPKI